VQPEVTVSGVDLGPKSWENTQNFVDLAVLDSIQSCSNFFWCGSMPFPQKKTRQLFSVFFRHPQIHAVSTLFFENGFQELSSLAPNPRIQTVPNPQIVVNALRWELVSISHAFGGCMYILICCFLSQMHFSLYVNLFVE